MKKILPVFAVVMTAALASPPGEPAPHARPSVAAASVTTRGAGSTAYEGVVEAVRQTVVSAQVPGAVVALPVRAGDTVQAGQVLVRIDARAADQVVAAGDAQARAARAAMDIATRELERQRQLLAQGFISQAALDRAEAQSRTAQAEASAQLATAEAARTQSTFHVVKAPYAGVVASVSVVLGEMALPGRPLLTLYDPGRLRVSAAVPQTAVAGRAAPTGTRAEIPGVMPDLLEPVEAQVLRLELPPGTKAVPGMFARAWLPSSATILGTNLARLFVPAQALVHRSELTAVYVVDRDGKPLLRQVRPGRSEGTEVEILSGVATGERVALDPQAAARIR